jgi:hypothetical protein
VRIRLQIANRIRSHCRPGIDSKLTACEFVRLAGPRRGAWQANRYADYCHAASVMGATVAPGGR